MNDTKSTAGADGKGEMKPMRFIIIGAKRDGQRHERLTADTPAGVTPLGRLKIDMLSPAMELLANVLLGSSDTLVFLAPCKCTNLVVFCVNVDTKEQTVTVGHVAKGASAITDTNSRCKGRLLQVGGGPEEVLVVPGIDQGESIYGKGGTASKVTCFVYGQKVDK